MKCSILASLLIGTQAAPHYQDVFNKDHKEFTGAHLEGLKTAQHAQRNQGKSPGFGHEGTLGFRGHTGANQWSNKGHKTMGAEQEVQDYVNAGTHDLQEGTHVDTFDGEHIIGDEDLTPNQSCPVTCKYDRSGGTYQSAIKAHHIVDHSGQQYYT